jgi:hypothetical protein
VSEFECDMGATASAGFPPRSVVNAGRMRADVSLTAAAAALVAAVGLASATPASAQSIRDLFSREPNGRTKVIPGRYVAAQGQGFELEPENGHLLLRIDGSAEVWVLKASPGARGDHVYRDDAGRDVLRATRLGGLILFTPDRPTGTPVALDRKGADIAPPTMPAGALLQRLAQASARVSKSLRRLVPFEAPDVQPGSEPLVADAARVAADGVIQAAVSVQGRRRLAAVRRVRFMEGPEPLARVNGGALEIVIAPGKGYAGRPSSQRTLQAVAGAGP